MEVNDKKYIAVLLNNHQSMQRLKISEIEAGKSCIGLPLETHLSLRAASSLPRPSFALSHPHASLTPETHTNIVTWSNKNPPGVLLIKLVKSEIKPKLGQILTLSKSDLSTIWACFQATYMPYLVLIVKIMTDKMPGFEINRRLKKFYNHRPWHIPGILRNRSFIHIHIMFSFSIPFMTHFCSLCQCWN